MDLLKRRDPAYRKGGETDDVEGRTVAMTLEEMYERMRNVVRVKGARDRYLEQASDEGLLPPGITIEGEARLAEEEKEVAELPLSETIDNSITNDFEDLDL